MIEKGPFSTDGVRYSVTIIDPLTDPDNSDTDVFVYFREQGTKFVGTFVTVESVREYLNRARNANPDREGVYLATTGLVVVDRLTEDSIPEAVEQLIKDQMFFEIFQFCE